MIMYFFCYTENPEIQGIEEWLETLDLKQYENNFRVNGFDNLDFLVSLLWNRRCIL